MVNKERSVEEIVEKLPQGDMLADDIYGNQKEWYEKSTVEHLLQAERQKREEVVEKGKICINEQTFKDILQALTQNNNPK